MMSISYMQLEGGDNDLEPALPANKPSIVLFVDRSSDSSEIKEKSYEALRAFRELALYHQINDSTTVKSQQSSFGKSQSPMRQHPKLEISPKSRRITTQNDKTSVIIMDKGKHVRIDKIASDLQGSSLSEILTYLLQHKKEMKISSLAKGVGFELLSDDFTIKVADDLPSEMNVQSIRDSAKVATEDLKGSSHIIENQTPHKADSMDKELSESVGSELSVEEATNTDSSKLLSVIDEVVASVAGGESEKTSPGFETVERQLYFPGSRGSFFFSDGRFRLLYSLVHVSKVPNVVIIDPLSQQHYIFPEGEVVSYSSLGNFLDRFLNGSLLPYQHSEAVTHSPKEAPRPPFVNLDFHEVDSIPRVSIHTFSELVIGNQSDLTTSGNAWKKDVLVLFSNSWCGFCQRMELVVREVHLAFRRYARMLKDGIGEEKSSLATGKLWTTFVIISDC